MLCIGHLKDSKKYYKIVVFKYRHNPTSIQVMGERGMCV